MGDRRIRHRISGRQNVSKKDIEAEATKAYRIWFDQELARAEANYTRMAEACGVDRTWLKRVRVADRIEGYVRVYRRFHKGRGGKKSVGKKAKKR